MDDQQKCRLLDVARLALFCEGRTHWCYRSAIEDLRDNGVSVKSGDFDGDALDGELWSKRRESILERVRTVRKGDDLSSRCPQFPVLGGGLPW